MIPVSKLQLSFMFVLVMLGLMLYDRAMHPIIPPTGYTLFDHWRARQVALYANDFGQLQRYRADDKAVLAAPPPKNRVIFFGDSIIDYWKLPEFFGNKPYINRGIAGQTTTQMLVRFRHDVLELKPKLLVMLASNNDIAGNTGPMSLQDMEANYQTITELAREHGIKLIFISMLPVHNYIPDAHELFAQRPMARIKQVNDWLQAYCAQNNIPYVDGFTAVLDEHGLLRKDFTEDGLHPNAAGYKAIAPLVEAAIEQELN